MALSKDNTQATNLKFTSGETSKTTIIQIYKYFRPTPGSNPVREPVGSVVLPYPTNPVPDNYSMSVGATNLGVFGNIPSFSGLANNPAYGPPTNPFQDIVNSSTQLVNTIGERVGVSGGGWNQSITGLAAGFLALSPGISDSQLGQTVQSMAGIVPNPHTTMLFNGVNLREFDLAWSLSPRDAQQSKNIDSIIKLLKVSMHPNKLIGNFALDYPNLFRISFNNDKQGTAEVDYAFISDLTAEVPTHAYYSEGYPSLINLRMHVKETRIKTAEDFSGYTAITGETSTSDTNFK